MLRRFFLSLALLLTLGAGCASAAVRASTKNTGTSTTPSTTVPAGVAANDIIILLVSIDTTGQTLSTKGPSGFTNLSDVTVTLDGQEIGVWWKRTSGADSGSYTLSAITSAAFSAIAVAFSGRDTTNPPVNATNASSNAANASPMTLTANGVTAVLGDDLIWLGAMDISGTAVGSFAAPSGYALKQDAEAADVPSSASTKENVAAGATGTVAAVYTDLGSTGGWFASLIRIPLSSGGAPACTDSHMLGVWRCDEGIH